MSSSYVRYPTISGGGSGTVTSVGLAAPNIFTVSGSPVVNSGTLTLSLATEVANTIFAGPTTGADAAPTFRTLVSADIPLLTNANISNSAAIAYSKLALTGSIVNADINASAAIVYSKLSLTGSIVNADINASAAIAYSKLALAASILNADISASAAIAYSKLNLTTSIVNGDISTSAAIAYSKLALTGSIVNADINASAAIAYSKLNLATSIVNADIASGAAIALSKLAALSTNKALQSDGSGVVSVSAVTNTELGFVSGVTSAIQTQLNSITATAPTLSPNFIGNLTIATSVAANALTISFVDKSGAALSSSNTASINFRSSTATAGTLVTRTIATAGPTLVVPSGATLGQTNAVPAKLYIYAIDNAGTMEVAIAGEKFQDEDSIVSTTAIGAGSSSNSVLYSTSARTNVACRLIAVVNNTQTTAGTWASAGSAIISPQMEGPKTIDNALIGVIDGTSAPVGVPGEIITANASNVNITTAGALNITSISLTAGRWLLGATGQYAINSAVLTFGGNNFSFDITPNSAGAGASTTNSNVYLNLNGASGTVSSVSGSIYGYVVNVTATTTYYLVSNFNQLTSGTVKASGCLYAIRLG